MCHVCYSSLIRLLHNGYFLDCRRWHEVRLGTVLKGIFSQSVTRLRGKLEGALILRGDQLERAVYGLDRYIIAIEIGGHAATQEQGVGY